MPIPASSPSGLMAREAALISRFSIIEDPQERLQALSSTKPKLPGVAENEQVDDNLVQGCSSPVWLTGRLHDGHLQLAMSSPTPLVASLAGIFCDLCHNIPPDEIQQWEPRWLQDLGIEGVLSATRQHGLRSVLLRIRELSLSGPRPASP
jgi:cysteine desulfuration protein SufE